MYEENCMYNYFFFVTKWMHTGLAVVFFLILEGMETDCIYQGYFHWLAEQQLNIMKWIVREEESS